MDRGHLAELLSYGSAPCANPTPAAEIPAARVLRWVEIACAFQKAGTACLLRSVVGARVLKAAGADVTIVLGVRTSPYQGHAWLEANGQPIGRDGELAANFVVIRRIH